MERAVQSFEDLLLELDHLGARLLEQHRRELGDGQHAVKAGALPRNTPSFAARLPQEDDAYSLPPADAESSLADEDAARVSFAKPADEGHLGDSPKRPVDSPGFVEQTPSELSLAVEAQQATGTRFLVRDAWISVLPVTQLVGPNVDPYARFVSDLETAPPASVLSEQEVVILQSKENVWARLILHPEMWLVILWSYLSLMLIAYDTATVPIYTFYDFEYIPWIITFLDWLARLFWTFDMPLSFMTGFHHEGYIEMRPWPVARAYLRSWFSFDIVVVLADWASVAVPEKGVLSTVPVLRGLRFIRVLRLLRLGRLSHLVNDIMLYASDGVTITVRIVKLTCGLCIGIHLLACVWYGVGAASSSGWVSQEESGLGSSATLAEQYIVSVNWVISQLQGTSHMRSETMMEIVFQSLVLLAANAFVAVFIANTTQVMLALTDSQSIQMQQVCRRYLRRRRISPELSHQVRTHFGGRNLGRAALVDSEEAETKLIESLPLLLQQRLYEEVRLPLLKVVPLFRREGFTNTRMLRRVCCEAVAGTWLAAGEMVFGVGETCNRMLVIESGTAQYLKSKGKQRTVGARERSLRPKLTRSAFSGEMEYDGDLENRKVSRGCEISEGALWTRWVNQGELFAEGDCSMLAVDHELFARALGMYESTVALAIRYAKCYVYWLNEKHREGCVSDLLETPRDILGYLAEIAESHNPYVFISHFKEEAGSDAALIEEGLTRIVREDPGHPAFNLERPIFLDSNDLADIATLREIVASSHNVCLLLTDHVLQRPWVLVEIVTAIKAGVPITLVTIQRPGVDFQFPAECNGAHLMNGLSSRARGVLAAQGVTDSDLDAVGQIFSRIALPFSPHKSGHVREAELLDILNRCQFNGSDVQVRRATGRKTTDPRRKTTHGRATTPEEVTR